MHNWFGIGWTQENLGLFINRLLQVWFFVFVVTELIHRLSHIELVVKFFRSFFVWAPFIFMLKSYDNALPLTVFATLSVIGGVFMVIIHQNQYKVYLENCERRMQAMRAVRTISNAGLDWIKGVRRNSRFEIEQNRRKSVHDTIAEDSEETPKRPSTEQNERL